MIIALPSQLAQESKVAHYTSKLRAMKVRPPTADRLSQIPGAMQVKRET
jgi:hypothetical protein